MKKYVIMLAKTFPRGHSRYGDLTKFKSNFNDKYKKHTIRGNYDLWERRFKEIEAGKACLSVREWEGAPYRSKQIEISRLTKDDGIGLEKLFFYGGDVLYPKIKGVPLDFDFIENLAANDGLNLVDWQKWFGKMDLTESFAVIHFTKFRYIYNMK